MRPIIVICDIDGTVAIHEGRRDHFEWALVPNDLPNVPVIALVTALMRRGTRIHYVSGREDVCRYDTTKWLDRYGIGLGDSDDHRLLMRSSRDYRSDTIIKREIYEREIEPFFDVWFVLDDRDAVVDMWRGLGLTCLQVARGPF